LTPSGLDGGVILRDGFNVRGLNTAATLWCSAAVGVLAASGHLAFAVIGTVTVLAVHVLGRPLGRLIDHDNPAEAEEDLLPYQLHITCKPKGEPRIRALIVQETGSSEAVLRGVDTTRTEDGSQTRLIAHLLLRGDAATRLEALVARLSLEPGINDVHWHRPMRRTWRRRSPYHKTRNNACRPPRCGSAGAARHARRPHINGGSGCHPIRTFQCPDQRRVGVPRARPVRDIPARSLTVARV